jgi:Tfp pilus assembly PilM family ATPase
MTTVVRTRSPLTRWLASRPPGAAVEITPARVTGVSVAYQGGTHVVAGHATAGLAPGAVDAALNAPNVHDAAALTAAIAGVLDRLAPRPKRVGLVLPDTAAKVSLVRFEKVPPRVQDLDQLIRWQVRKAAPFRIEDAQVAWIPGHAFAEGSREFLVTIARRDVIESYEKACAAAGAYAGIVDIASFNLVNLMLATRESSGREAAASARATPAGDWLLVHAAADYATLAVVRGGDVIFFRNRTTAGEGDLADLVHQTTMYHEDRLGGGGFSRIVLAGATARGTDQAERLRRQLEERTGTRAEPAEFGPAIALRDRISASADLLDTIAPAVGMLLRERMIGRGAPEPGPTGGSRPWDRERVA